MPEQLKSSEVSSKTDPSVAKQYDTTTSTSEQFVDFYKIADDNKVAMLVTHRADLGPVARSMAVAKRSGPDFLFLANAHSQKFTDIASDKTVSLTFHDSSNENWISVTGTATTSNSDPRIKEIYSKPVKAWFGDLGDKVHTGGPEDPRMTLIEVKSKYITYYKKESSMLGTVKEVGGAVLTGGVANLGALRELKEREIQDARERDSALTNN